MALVGCYLSIVDLYLHRLRHPGRFVAAVTTACVALNVYYLDFSIPMLARRSSMLETRLADWMTERRRLRNLKPVAASLIMSDAIRSGVYKVPDSVKAKAREGSTRPRLPAPRR
jgi:hypothetical protein